MALNTQPIPPYWERDGRPDNTKGAGRRKAKGKGKGKGKRKGKGKGKHRSLHTITKEVSQLKAVVKRVLRRGKPQREEERAKESDLREADRKKRNEEVASIQARVCNYPDETFSGVFVRKTRTYGWIRLDYFFRLPSELQTAVMQMLEAKQKRLFDNSKEDKLFNSFVVFMHSYELKDKKCRPRLGDRLSFKLYTDNIGVGAYDISLEEQADDS